ncbi:phosphatidate cytidylyltransferase, mitochondrial isoform X1 [Strigops habroptila]|uniref:phosphatidate cytidylyltransferase, mitochondrial isoform X1 n=1 Tax=Strigops habroptila TaxID=2489341 RepID=UPI0011CEF32D|nr:phosphatidate cytidylyltransferase, mitochondrial isoform X1 [Strigops habroptila]XP_030358034.1 phosphatidate cytidylyltransferase, mitochondrial isoform X1 [Strigops habroptila]XP_030358035.1 phosphatidate cytidylyltransferase, mitochondrial isoform X1 [Strigops habroptila]XP_030358036.1 phosphatidate cytidylyltransferase, mitochondrial isoform X1 [Strigops habroptila]XP_030358037.1 phosphatidate cytidylyltransferase, mitochondrial isoform X1 [Strigops habroptila]XP_030358040.1 phosphatid
MALPALSSSGVKFRRVLAHFPQELSLAFAYGSGVFRQAGDSAGPGENNMLDFVFAVDDSVTWHMMNLTKNRSHYSFLKVLGPKQINSVQNYGAGIYYNTLVPCNGRMIKYGVISTDTLIDDLLHWKTLYVAGRLQKPVKNKEGKTSFKNPLGTNSRLSCRFDVRQTHGLVQNDWNKQPVYCCIHHHIKMRYCSSFSPLKIFHHNLKVKILTQNENSKLQAALVSNLKSAVTAAFLMLPESFSEEDLYMQIAGLSYTGDFRMIVGEDRSKVQNIVEPNVPHFQKLYSNILQDCPQVVYKHHLGRLEIDKSPEGQFAQLMALPRTLQQKITSLVDPPGKNRDVEEILLQVAHDPDCGFVVQQGISRIVRPSSVVQSAKTILTAGVKKSVTYSMKKLYKMTKGWLRKTS